MGESPDPRLRGLRIELAAPPFAGHLFPLLALGRRWAEAGADVGLLTGPNRVDLARRCGLDAVPLAADDPRAMERIADPPHRLHGRPLRQLGQLRANLDLMIAVAPDVRVRLRDRRPDVVVADFCAPVAGWAAEDLGIPWITTIPTPFALETLRGTPSYLGGWRPPRSPVGRGRDALGRAAVRLAKRLVEIAFRSRFRALGRGLHRRDGTEAVYSPIRILGLGLAELELPRDWPAAFRWVGPITEAPASDSGSVRCGSGSAAGSAGAVASQRRPLDMPPGPAVLVTLGTHLRWARAGLLDRLGRLFAAFPDRRFVVSEGRFDGPGPDAGRTGPNWSVVPWVDYDRELASFATIVHHGGAGVTLGAIRAGVPALVCPHDYDQFDFAVRIEEAGAGIAVSRLDSGRAAAALGRLLAGEGADGLLRLRQALSRCRPFETATGELLEVVDEAGGAAE